MRVKTILLKISAGIISSILIMAGGFYFFMFANPLHIHQVNLLKWIPILICFAALYTSGMLTRKVPAKYLPLLFLPFAVFDLFNFLHFPIIR